MNFRYHPDIDVLEIEFSRPTRQTDVNVTHIAQASLDENGRVCALSIDDASRQLPHLDLIDGPPPIRWNVFGFGVSLLLTNGSDRETQNNREFEFGFYPESDALYINFTDGPAYKVVDITGCDLADVNKDGTLSGITLSFAADLLQINEPANEFPTVTWNTYNLETRAFEVAA